MRNINIITVLFLLFSLNCISQTNDANPTLFDSLLQRKLYRIELSGNQFVEVIELANGSYSGHLVNLVWENSRKKYRTKLIVQRIKFSESVSKKLMLNLEKKEIENIPNCIDTKDCITNGLDGTLTNITITKKDMSRSYNYWEVESNHYYKNGNIPKEIQQIRNILHLLDETIHYRQHFRKFVDYLPNGSYSFDGTTMVKF